MIRLLVCLSLLVLLSSANSEIRHPAMARMRISTNSGSEREFMITGDYTGHLKDSSGSVSPSPDILLDPPEVGRVWTLAEDIQYPHGSFKLGSPLCFNYTRKVVADNNNNFVVGWETGAACDNEVMGIFWNESNGIWTIPVTLSESESDAGRLDLVMDMNGNVHGVWHQNHDLGGNSYEIYYSKLQSGSASWTDPVMLSRLDEIESNFPTVHVDNMGNVTARWSDLTRDAAGAILAYHGYRVLTSHDWGTTWHPEDAEWAVEDTLRLMGAGCSDHETGDIYLVDLEYITDSSDYLADLVVYHYDKAADIWQGPQILQFGGTNDEPSHAITYASATVGSDGVVHILSAQTADRFDWYYPPDQVDAPTGGRLFHIHGVFGSWSEPEVIYPGTDGIIEGYNDIYPDSTFRKFTGYSQIATDMENNLYLTTRSVEYFNGQWVSGQSDMHSEIGGGKFQPEAWVAKRSAVEGSEWVWTRASDVNLRPDSIGIKYTKITEHVPSSGPAIVWDETYDGGMPSKVMFTRVTDFKAPGSVINLTAERPVENGPITLTWENPEAEDLAGIRVIRSTVGKAHLVGLRRGSIPMNADGDFLYPSEDIWVVYPDSAIGYREMQFYDSDPPEGDVYYTVIPFDGHFHHTYPLGENDYVMVPSVVSGEIPNPTSGVLSLSTSKPCPIVYEAEILFSVPQDGNVCMAIYDMSGRLVRSLLDESMPAGTGRVYWDTRNGDGIQVGSGAYLCRLEQHGAVATCNLVVLH